MRRKPNLDARIKKCEHLLIADPEAFRGRWYRIFPYKELHVELGCGKGIFTVEMARANPEILFVALEKSANVLVIALEMAQRENVRNVRFINALADDMESFFAPDEVFNIYLNFSDPWPAKRHAKRRMTSPIFLASYRQVLCPMGKIQLKTDNIHLFEYSLDGFECAGFTLLEKTRDLHKDGQVGVMTDYERKFHSLGMPIYQCIAAKGTSL